MKQEKTKTEILISLREEIEIDPNTSPAFKSLIKKACDAVERTPKELQEQLMDSVIVTLQDYKKQMETEKKQHEQEMVALRKKYGK